MNISFKETRGKEALMWLWHRLVYKYYFKEKRSEQSRVSITRLTRLTHST